MSNRILLFIVCLGAIVAPAFSSALEQHSSAENKSPAELVAAAIEYWRDSSSYTLSDMTVHRPDWERTMRMRSWTKETDKSLVRFTKPAKDAGNASLKIDDALWSYSPKVNRVVRIPPSMMHQSWMGSDFSYNDLAKADDLLHYYDHSLVATHTREGHMVYVVEAVPHEAAPVVWGKERLAIRDDYILLRHAFFDQEMKLVRELVTKKIAPLGGKLYPAVMRMQQSESPAEWSEVVTKEATFGEEIPDRVFTVANLRNPRE